MTTIRIPHPERKRALIVVDMQSGFLTEGTRWIIPNVQAVIEKGNYDMYIDAVFHAEPGSVWDKQTHWTFPLESTIPEVKNLLVDKNAVVVTKTTKSAFQGDKDLVALCKEKNIEEVHVVGLDANDCVMATAFDSFDAGLWTYVIEECVDSSEGVQLRDAALAILRNVEMTNSSEYVTSDISISTD